MSSKKPMTFYPISCIYTVVNEPDCNLAHSGSKYSIWLKCHGSTTGASTASPLRHPNYCPDASKCENWPLKIGSNKITSDSFHQKRSTSY